MVPMVLSSTVSMLATIAAIPLPVRATSMEMVSDDLIVGAPGFALLSGQSYVIFGSKSRWSSPISLLSLNGANGFILNGINFGDQSGNSVASAGDVNGDGIDDLIVGAPSLLVTGQSYVVFGSNKSWSSPISLSSLNGNNGFTINGINAGDQSGWSVASAGDVNGDGIDDLIIGADDASLKAGQSYVVFGQNASTSSSTTTTPLLRRFFNQYWCHRWRRSWRNFTGCCYRNGCGVKSFEKRLLFR